MEQNQKNSNKDLASEDKQAREKVVNVGGKAEHQTRGMQGSDQKTREKVNKKGGQARHS